MKKIFVLITLTYFLASCDKNSESKTQDCNEKTNELISHILLENEFDAIIKIERDSLSSNSEKLISKNLKIKDSNFIARQIKCFEQFNFDNITIPKTKIVTLKEFGSWIKKNPTADNPKDEFINDLYPRGLINFERIIFSEDYLNALVITTVEKSNLEINKKVVLYHFERKWKIKREIPYFSN